MAHYATLNEYRFDADVDDIRGATLYGRDGEKLAKIDDVVFDQQAGEIQYFIAKSDKGRRVLVPLDHVFVTAVDEKSFSSDLSRADLERLPEFDENSLHHDERWREFKKRHDEAIERLEKQARKEYKREYEEDPVEHRVDDPSRIITPPSSEMPVSTTASSERNDKYVPDLTPQRLSPVFSGTANTSDKLNMVPQTDSLRDTQTGYDPDRLGARFSHFAACVRRDVGRIRTGCAICDSERKVA